MSKTQNPANDSEYQTVYPVSGNSNEKTVFSVIGNTVGYAIFGNSCVTHLYVFAITLRSVEPAVNIAVNIPSG